MSRSRSLIPLTLRNNRLIYIDRCKYVRFTNKGRETNWMRNSEKGDMTTDTMWTSLYSLYSTSTWLQTLHLRESFAQRTGSSLLSQFNFKAHLNTLRCGSSYFYMRLTTSSSIKETNLRKIRKSLECMVWSRRTTTLKRISKAFCSAQSKIKSSSTWSSLRKKVMTMIKMTQQKKGITSLIYRVSKNLICSFFQKKSLMWKMSRNLPALNF